MKNKIPEDFDGQIYLLLNPDVAKAKIDPHQHFLDHGIKEGRKYKIYLEEILGNFTDAYPDIKNSFKIFTNSWSTKFEGIENLGSFDAQNDERINWLLKKVNLSKKKVLELGPLEAGHTYKLEKAGASVTAIEANTGAFLRCLIVKNYYNLKSNFIYGDFEVFDYASQKFDLIVASGVLYHMKDPVQFLENISRCSEKLFLWTHFFEPDHNKWNPVLKDRISEGKWGSEEIISSNGEDYRSVKFNYNSALNWSGFCGGTDTFSRWLYKEDLLKILEKQGFTKIDIAFEDYQHQNGPCFCIFAEKPSKKTFSNLLKPFF